MVVQMEFLLVSELAKLKALVLGRSMDSPMEYLLVRLLLLVALKSVRLRESH